MVQTSIQNCCFNAKNKTYIPSFITFKHVDVSSSNGLVSSKIGEKRNEFYFDIDNFHFSVLNGDIFCSILMRL